MQLLLTLNVRDSASQNRHSTSTTPLPQQNRQSLNFPQIPENFFSISSHVKFLNSPIYWIWRRRCESLAWEIGKCGRNS